MRFFGLEEGKIKIQERSITGQDDGGLVAEKQQHPEEPSGTMEL